MILPICRLRGIDAVNLLCFYGLNTMKSKENYYEVMVDAPAPLENVTRYARSQGYMVEVEDKGGEYLIKISK